MFYPQQGRQRNPSDVSELKTRSACLSTGRHEPPPRCPPTWNSARRPDGGRLNYQSGVSSASQKASVAKLSKIRAVLFARGSESVPRDTAGVSRPRANRSRSLRNLATQRSKIPIAVRSTGSPHDRARKPAQDAVSRNRQLAMDDFSDDERPHPREHVSRRRRQHPRTPRRLLEDGEQVTKVVGPENGSGRGRLGLPSPGLG